MNHLMITILAAFLSTSAFANGNGNGAVPRSCEGGRKIKSYCGPVAAIGKWIELADDCNTILDQTLTAKLLKSGVNEKQCICVWGRGEVLSNDAGPAGSYQYTFIDKTSYRGYTPCY